MVDLGFPFIAHPSVDPFLTQTRKAHANTIIGEMDMQSFVSVVFKVVEPGDKDQSKTSQSFAVA